MKKRNIPGPVRMLDDLGRIVVPREIRSRLRLKEGDFMEINVTGSRIILEKYQPACFWEEMCGPYLEALARGATAACVICGTEQILSSGTMDIQKGTQLSRAAKERIREREPYLYDEGEQMALLEDGSHAIDALYPVGTEETSQGGVALLRCRAVTDTDRLCARLLADIITETIKKEEETT